MTSSEYHRLLRQVELSAEISARQAQPGHMGSGRDHDPVNSTRIMSIIVKSASEDVGYFPRKQRRKIKRYEDGKNYAVGVH